MRRDLREVDLVSLLRALSFGLLGLFYFGGSRSFGEAAIFGPLSTNQSKAISFVRGNQFC